MLDLVRNLEDRFSRVAAHFKHYSFLLIFIIRARWPGGRPSVSESIAPGYDPQCSVLEQDTLTPPSTSYYPEVVALSPHDRKIVDFKPCKQTTCNQCVSTVDNWIIEKRNEPPRWKTNNVVSQQV